MCCRLNSLIMALAVLTGGAWAQPPAGFRWVDFKREPDLVSRITRALQTEEYSAIREIGIVADSALVFTTTRDTNADTPDDDIWSVYSVSVATEKFRKLFSAYDVHIAAWLKFMPGHPDLGVTYLDCSGCDPAMFFTALHEEPGKGWRARWPAKNPRRRPGILVLSSDAGTHDTDEDIDQVWAVLAPLSGPASVGTWYYARNRTTGKVTNITTKWQVGSSAQGEESTTFSGAAAVRWQRTLCRPADGISTLMGGQNAKICKDLFHPPPGAKKR